MSIWTSTTTLPPTRSRRRRQAGAVVLLLLLLSLSICSDRPNHGLSLMLLCGDSSPAARRQCLGNIYPVGLPSCRIHPINTWRLYKYIWHVCMSHVFEPVTNTYFACICRAILMFSGMIYVITGQQVCRGTRYRCGAIYLKISVVICGDIRRGNILGGYTRPAYTRRLYAGIYTETYAETYTGSYTRGYKRAVTSMPRVLCLAAMHGYRFLGGYTRLRYT